MRDEPRLAIPGLTTRGLTNRDQRPLYVQTAEEIERLIERDGLATGDRLPAEAQLAEQLGVSRSTIREALRELELRGRIERAHGRGTMVASVAPIVTGLPVLESLESLAERQGWRCGTESVRIEQVPLPAEMAGLLEIPAGAPATYLSRVKTRDWHPIARMETWCAADLLGTGELRARFKSSITELLLVSDGGLKLDYAVAQVSAAAADDETASALHVPPGSPLVVLAELFYATPARPLCYSRNSFVPDSIQLEVMRLPATRLRG
jgi:GntR family transcriptional regulator